MSTSAPAGCSFLTSAEIIPDVLPETFAVENAKDATVTLGGLKFSGMLRHVIDAAQTDETPQLQWEAAPDKHDTVILTDPDAPARTSPLYVVQVVVNGI